MRRHIGPAISGLLVAASMPPWGWWPLAFLGLAIFASLARTRRQTYAFSTSFVFALAWFLPAMAWMWFLTAPGFLLAVVLFASLHGVAGLVASRLATSDQSFTASLLVCMALVETLRLSWPFGGVPLATLAISQAASPLAALAPYLGVIGLSAVVLWLSMTTRKIRTLLVIVLAVGVASMFDGTGPTGESHLITFVQGGGKQGTHAIDTNPRDVFNVHLAATRTIAPNPNRLAVIWPENVINISSKGLFTDSPEFLEIGAEAQRLGVPLVVGITESAGATSFTNAQVVVEPDGRISGRYDKVRRVPFGEYIPLRPILSSVGAPVDLVPRDARAGDARAWLDISGHRAAVVISWEVFFGGRVNEGVKDGATFIINPTNGSSYTGTILQSQQVAASRLRAREQGRWLVQVSPTGFSAFISPKGEVHQRTSISSPAVVEQVIAAREGRTPYSRLGNGMYFWLLLVAFAWRLRQQARAIPRPAS